MRNDVVVKRQNWRITAVAVVSGLALLVGATSAFAHDDEDDQRGKHRGRHFVPPGHVYYYAPPVYYAPRPAYYAPRPVLMYPAPTYYEPVPAYYPPPGLTINIPLR